MSNSNKIFTINEGVMWDENPFEIRINEKCEESGGTDCRHCHSHAYTITVRKDGSIFSKNEWICPAVVIVKNQGGYDSTGLCLDCLLDAVKTNNIR